MFHVVFQATRPDMIFKVLKIIGKVRFWLWQSRYIHLSPIKEGPADVHRTLLSLNTTVESTNRFHAITSSLVLKCNPDRTVQEEPIHFTQVCPGQALRKI